MKTKAIQLLSAACVVIPAAVAQTQERPNVILIYTDDQGSLDMNCYGASDLYTPNMDALAKKGVRFTRFYAAPYSSPSRASLLTGQFCRHAGLWKNADDNNFLPPEKTTIAERLKQEGYATGLIGKWHLGNSDELSPNAQGFDYFFGHRGGCIDNYSHFVYWGGPNRHDLWRNKEEVFYYGQFFAGINVTEIKNFIADHEKQPFFLYWATNMPHYPLQPQPKWLDYYKDLKYPRNLYAAFLSTFDEVLGEVMLFLEKKNLLENTIIILQSDNGHSTEERNHFGGGYAGAYRGCKASMFEGGIRIPAIISWPGKIPQNEVREQTCMNIDWFPTLLDLCGIPNTQENEMDGKSLLPLITDNKNQSPHKELYFDSWNQWAVIQGDWKLIGNPEDPTNPESITKADSLFLTNINKDISESVNLANQYPKVVEQLMKVRKTYLSTLEK